MCDTATSDILESIVRQNVSARTMFTSFDVSRTAQQQHGVHERHQNMKNEAHKFFATGVMGDFQRVTVTLPGVPVDPWLYYPPESDPADYVSPHTGQSPTAINGTPVSSAKTATATGVKYTTPTPPSSAITDDDDDSEDDGTPKSDKRGRCWVPVKLVAALGLKTGDIGYVTRGTFGIDPAVKITANLDPTATEAVAYKVDRHGNIAISKGCLEEAGVVAPSGTQFDITGDTTCIVVRVALVTVAAGQLVG